MEFKDLTEDQLLAASVALCIVRKEYSECAFGSCEQFFRNKIALLDPVIEVLDNARLCK